MIKEFFKAPADLKIWAIFLISFPFYFFPAGDLQISDFIMALFFVKLIASGNLIPKQRFKQYMKFFTYFLVYLIIVNMSVWAIYLGQKMKGLPGYIMSSFYIYNYLVFGLSFALYRRFKLEFIRLSFIAVIFALALQIILQPFASGVSSGTTRGIFFFANPNQLGYYSLISLTMILLFEKMLVVKPLVKYGAFAICTYMAMQSLSQAAVFSIIILIGLYFLESGFVNVKSFFAIAFVGLIGFLVIANTEFGKEFTSNFEKRATEEREEGVTEFEYRGYDRIINHPGYLVLGAGEGAYNRFDTYIENHEIHSSFGTILFCYGIPGITLFLTFIFRLFIGIKWKVAIYILPILAYGMTHMGLRFTIFWVSLSFFPIFKEYLKDEKIRLLLLKENKIKLALLNKNTVNV